MGIPSAAHDDQNQNHDYRNGDEAAASAAVSATTAAIVVVSAAGRAAEVAVESRHVLGIARIAFAEVAIITV